MSYYQDDFHPTLKNDDDNTTDIEHSRDKYYFKIWKKNSLGKTIPIELYGTPIFGGKIRNALTGGVYNIPVGSRFEGLFFSVRDTTLLKHKKYQACNYFFDTPEQFEKIYDQVVDNDTKSQWRVRYNWLLKEYETNLGVVKEEEYNDIVIR